MLARCHSPQSYPASLCAQVSVGELLPDELVGCRDVLGLTLCCVRHRLIEVGATVRAVGKLENFRCVATRKGLLAPRAFDTSVNEPSDRQCQQPDPKEREVHRRFSRGPWTVHVFGGRAYPYSDSAGDGQDVSDSSPPPDLISNGPGRVHDVQFLPEPMGRTVRPHTFLSVRAVTPIQARRTHPDMDQVLARLLVRSIEGSIAWRCSMVLPTPGGRWQPSAPGILSVPPIA